VQIKQKIQKKFKKIGKILIFSKKMPPIALNRGCLLVSSRQPPCDKEMIHSIAQKKHKNRNK